MIKGFVKLYYKEQGNKKWCEKAIFPNGREVYMQEGTIDLSPLKDYIGYPYIITMSNRIMSVGIIKDYKTRDDGVGQYTIEPQQENDGWWNKY